MSYRKKLIEVALPLEAINAASAREKSIRHGHPSTLHLWWSRKPLATARAVLFSSLVDDPSSRPEEFPSPEAQEKERQRLFRLIEQLVLWENVNNEELLAQAKAEVMRSTDGNPPPVLDPFAGGGSIPLEAQRLGLEAHASDLNPVAVLINKAMIEIPPRFANQAPVNPEARAQLPAGGWKGAAGLAEDVRYYGDWLREQAEQRIGHLYPKAKLPDGGEATVIAWKWARTVKCPNPACGAEMPLVNSFELSKKKGKEAFVEPVIVGNSVQYAVKQGKGKVQPGTISRAGATCICCKTPVPFSYIRKEGQAGRMGAKLMAIIADGAPGRIYLAPNDLHVQAANVLRPDDYPDYILPHNPRDFKTSNYGMDHFADLFTQRQLTALATLGDQIPIAMKQAELDALAAGLAADGIGLDQGGQGARAYGQAIGVYLAMLLDKQVDLGNSLNRWEPVAQCPRQLFARQAIPMVWDYAEGNPLGSSSGSWSVLLANLFRTLNAPSFAFERRSKGVVAQRDATAPNGLQDILVSTDPPYYDNIGYADLSDFFYVWLRRSLRELYPDLFSTILVPKREELIASPYRHDGDAEAARSFFENGMLGAFRSIRVKAHPAYPTTVYYAFKQSDIQIDGDSEKSVSTGWETMLSALIQADFSITGTWPMRTEMMSRSAAQGTNALASSIVLVCRPRPEDAGLITKREFINLLRRELRSSVTNLQSGNIAPVDLAQAAIGPGMAVFSRYQAVLEPNGEPVSVREALALINQELDAFLAEQEGDMDEASRFCVTWFEQFGMQERDYGEADLLSRAKNTSIDALEGRGVFIADKGKARLLQREELPDTWNPAWESVVWATVQHLARTMDKAGIDGAAGLLSTMLPANAANARALAYRLFNIAERKGWTEEALAYNALVMAWPDIQRRAEELQRDGAEVQLGLRI